MLTDQEEEELLGGVDAFFGQLVYDVGVCDYAVTSIENVRSNPMTGLFDGTEGRIYKNDVVDGWNGNIELRRLGEVVVPVEVEVTFEDGSMDRFRWNGKDALMKKTYGKKVVSCHIDPERLVFVDIDRLNNSYTLAKDNWPTRKVGVKTIFWIQNILQSLSFLV